MKAILWIMFICVAFFEQWAHIMPQSVCFPIDNPEQLKPQKTLFWDVGSRSTQMHVNSNHVSPKKSTWQWMSALVSPANQPTKTSRTCHEHRLVLRLVTSLSRGITLTLVGVPGERDVRCRLGPAMRKLLGNRVCVQTPVAQHKERVPVPFKYANEVSLRWFRAAFGRLGMVIPYHFCYRVSSSFASHTSILFTHSCTSVSIVFGCVAYDSLHFCAAQVRYCTI